MLDRSGTCGRRAFVAGGAASVVGLGARDGAVAHCGTRAQSTAAGGVESTVDGDWPMAQYDDRNTAHHPDATAPREEVAVHWKFEAGPSPQATPVVDGVVYAATDDGDLYALDAAGGTERWRFSVDDVLGSPTVVDDVIYVPSQEDEPRLYAIDVGTGEEVWRADMWGPTAGHAVERDGVVYVTGNAIKAFDAADGEELWSVGPEKTVLGDAMATPPAVAGDTVYVGSTVYEDDTDALYALAADTGTERWIHHADDSIEAAPVVADGTVYAGSWDGNVYALDATTGDERWRFDTGAKVWASPAVADGSVYVNSEDGTLYALDAADGTERWRFDLGEESLEPPSVADGVVFASGDDQPGYLYALDATDGTERWRFEVPRTEVATPVVADGRLYLGGGHKHVWALGPPEPTSTAGGDTPTAGDDTATGPTGDGGPFDDGGSDESSTGSTCRVMLPVLGRLACSLLGAVLLLLVALLVGLLGAIGLRNRDQDRR